ncbi:Calcium/calmodulin-dependent 3',5'-cyclic nucleotide phosphodiesterase 1C, variant 2 [Chamberlinius hualienensis]
MCNMGQIPCKVGHGRPTNNNSNDASHGYGNARKWVFAAFSGEDISMCKNLQSSVFVSVKPNRDAKLRSCFNCVTPVVNDGDKDDSDIEQKSEKISEGNVAIETQSGSESLKSADNVWWSVKRVSDEQPQNNRSTTVCVSEVLDSVNTLNKVPRGNSVINNGDADFSTNSVEGSQLPKRSLQSKYRIKPHQKVELIIDETKFTIYKVKISNDKQSSVILESDEDDEDHINVASPPEKKCSKDDNDISTTVPVPSKNGQLSKQGGLKIFRRSTLQKRTPLSRTTRVESSTDDDAIDAVDLRLDAVPSAEAPEACEVASLRLRSILKRLRIGEVSSDILERNLQFAVQVLDAVYSDDRVVVSEDDQSPCSTTATLATTTTTSTVVPGDVREKISTSGTSDTKCIVVSSTTTRPTTVNTATSRAPSSSNSCPSFSSSSSKLWTCKVKRKTADEEDDLSEVQPDAVPPEVREWLASTFTRQLSARKKRTDEKPRFRTVAHAIRAGIFVERIYRRMSSTSMPQFPPQVVTLLKNLDDWSFDVFAVNDVSVGQPVRYIGFDLLNRYGIIHKFKISSTILESFLCNIEQGYCRYKNPYHNNVHAADVTQTVHYMLCQLGLMNWLTDLEVFATLVAAIIHDYEHTGTTNNFHVMSGSDTALLYNDRAVLENHHCSAAFRLIKEDENNILSNLSREEFREFRNLVIDMVLATDMSYHFQQIKMMKNLLLSPDSNIDKSKALSLVLHCCDISHPSKNWNLHHRWTELLIEEFFRQGDKEKDLGIPYSPLCDRNNTLVAESQIGFIDFIVEPSMNVCGDMLEKISLAMQSSKTLDGSITEESFDQSSASSGQTKRVVGKSRFQRSVGSTGSVSSARSSDDSAPNSPRNAASPTPFDFKRPWASCLNDNKTKWKERAVRDAELRAQKIKSGGAKDDSSETTAEVNNAS